MSRLIDGIVGSVVVNMRKFLLRDFLPNYEEVQRWIGELIPSQRATGVKERTRSK